MPWMPWKILNLKTPSLCSSKMFYFFLMFVACLNKQILLVVAASELAPSKEFELKNHYSLLSRYFFYAKAWLFGLQKA